MSQTGGNPNNPWQTPNGGAPQPGGPQPGGQPLPGQPAPAQQFGAPQPYQQPQQGFPAAAPQQPGQFGPEGYIELTLQGSAMTSNMLTPQVQIDGFPVPASYGVNRLPVPAGRHTVSAYATWIVKYGQASYDVDVQPGQTVPVFYAAPLVQFAKGSMGPVKQKRGGKGFFIGLMLVVVLIIIIAILVPIIASA